MKQIRFIQICVDSSPTGCVLGLTDEGRVYQTQYNIVKGRDYWVPLPMDAKEDKS